MNFLTLRGHRSETVPPEIDFFLVILKCFWKKNFNLILTLWLHEWQTFGQLIFNVMSIRMRGYFSKARLSEIQNWFWLKIVFMSLEDFQKLWTLKKGNDNFICFSLEHNCKNGQVQDWHSSGVSSIIVKIFKLFRKGLTQTWLNSPEPQ